MHNYAKLEKIPIIEVGRVGDFAHWLASALRN